MKIRISTSNKNQEYSLVDFRTIFFCTIIGLLNSFYYDKFVIMLGLCVIEVTILIWDFAHADYMSYLCHYLVMLCFSMESETFVGTSLFYGFKNFRIFGINLAVLMLLPLLLLAVLDYNVVRVKLGKTHKMIMRMLGLFTLFGCIMGFFTFLSNDNGFGAKQGSLNILVDTYYTYLVPIAQLLIATWVVGRENNTTKLKRYLFSITIALAVVFLACVIMGNYGNRGGLDSLQVSDVYFVLVASLAIIVYPQFKGYPRVLLISSSMIILVLSLVFNASGKIVITTVLIPILMLIIIKRQGHAAKTVFAIVSSVIAVIFVSVILLPKLAENSMLLNVKLEQASAMFTFTGENWLENMPSSPKMRITEFMNIAAEYLREPWFAIFGKGFGGTIVDNLNLFNDLSEFSFSSWELELGAYYSMHESLNCFFLVGGFLGLWCIIKIGLTLYRKIHKSPWLLLGFIWVLLFYNYHMTIAVYGIVALVVGLNDLKEKPIISRGINEL